jgi:radical SAM protein with 4Fe4S-binding SPASM domain
LKDSGRLQRVYVEITNVCNLRCRFCPGTDRPPAFMDPAFLGRILEQIAPLTGRVCLHVLGEPLLHPDFPAIMTRCAEAGIEVDLTTNGILLSRRAGTLLAAPALRQVNFSLQALRTVDGFDREALESILDFCLQAVRQRPELYVNLRLWTLDDRHDPMRDDFNAPVLDLVAQRLGIARPTPPAGRKSLRLQGRVYLHADTVFDWPGGLTGKAQARGFCHALSTHCAVLADGTVCPCCLDADGRLALGNLHESTLTDILASPRARAMRQGFARGELTEEVCRHCAYCRRFQSRAQRLHAAHRAQRKNSDTTSWTTTTVPPATPFRD